MNFVDLLLGAILLFSVFTGFSRGFIYGVTSFLAWLGSLAIGILLFDHTVLWLTAAFPRLGTWAAPVALLGTVFITHLLLSAMLGAFLREVDPRLHQTGLNRALGTLPGLARGWILATLLAALLLAFPTQSLLTDAARSSRLAGSLTRQAGWLGDAIPPDLKHVLGKAVIRLPEKTPSGETVALPFAVANAQVRPDLEAKMLALVNEERAKAGLKLLKSDPELLPVARAHSRDMFARSFFAHQNKDGKLPSDRIREAGVRFLTAGENLALGPTLQRCHRGLMESPGHRANILSPAFGRVGIAVLDGGFYGLMITQNFRN